MNLLKALRLPEVPRTALVGAGGKTTALFLLARQLPPPVILTTTTHLATAQLQLADRQYVLRSLEEFSRIKKELLSGVCVLTGDEAEPGRVSGLAPEVLDAVRYFSDEHKIPLLIEADGSRQKPLKAPAEHEPAIPTFASEVILLAGLAALGKPLTDGWVHRPERFAELAAIELGSKITEQAIAAVLSHPNGGLKNIPAGARRILLLNQADDEALRAAASRLAATGSLYSAFDSIITAALEAPGQPVFSASEPVAGIILAAGGARRYQAGSENQPKQLLNWGGETFVRRVVSTALAAGLSPVIVVLGAFAEQVRSSLIGLPVTFAFNPAWEKGQSTSIHAGLSNLPDQNEAVVFLLADQPQVPPELVRRLVEAHMAELPALVAPVVANRRANPVLFDRVTFAELQKLTGDSGGRALFGEASPFTPTWVPWGDPSLLLDVDTPEDYHRLLEMVKP